MSQADTDFDAAFAPIYPVKDFMDRAYAELIKGNSDLHAAFMAGCEIEFSSELKPDGSGLVITAKTKNPVAVDHVTGRVFERRVQG